MHNKHPFYCHICIKSAYNFVNQGPCRSSPQRWAKWHLLPSTYTSTFYPTGRRHTFCLKKKGKIGRLMLTILDIWEGRGRRHNVFYIESVKVHPSTSGSITLPSVFQKSTIYQTFRPQVGYSIAVEHPTDLQVSMPTSASPHAPGLHLSSTPLFRSCT